LAPSPITETVPGATLFINVIGVDAFGNAVTNVGAEQVEVNIVASPATVSDPNPTIPTSCYDTNGTAGFGCSVGFNSFGPISWTMPATIGTVATISASGILNGVSITSGTTSITIVAKTPTISVFSPKPLAGVIYSNSVNVQFRGWANASLGYNNCVVQIGDCNAAVTMSSLGWKVGSNSWQTSGLAGTNAQWSVVATLPSGLSTLQFNATDTKNNVVTSNVYQVLVDTSSPVVTNVTPAGTTLTSGQLFTAKIVDSEGDLNATSVGVTYNGTALSSSAITVSGANNLGSSVTYTVTAALPTSSGNPGHWLVQVTATNLAGNTGSSTPELVTVSVPFGDSITFTTASATWGPSGAAQGVFVPVTNSWPTAQQLTIYITMKSGTSTFVLVGGLTLAAGQTATVFCQDFLATVPAGTYTVTFSALTTANQAVSAPTTPITITVP